MKLRPSQPLGELLGPLAERIGVPAASAHTRVTGVTLRSQDVRPGDLFAALPGASAHGARFAADAVAAGAVAVLTDPAGVDQLPADLDAAVLVHPEPRAVLGALAADVYGHPSRTLRVIGVTGTSGKTTTTYLIEAGLRAAGRTAGLIGTVGIRIDGRDEPSSLTTPEAPDLQALLAVMLERGVDTVVMEVSSHALTLGRVDGTVFEAGGFTNLSRDHLDFHPTMEDYLDAKARLFEPDSPTHAARAVVCVDDDWGRRIADRSTSPVRVSAGVRTPTGGSTRCARSGGAVRSSSPSTPPGCTTRCRSGCRGVTTSPTRCSRSRCSTWSGSHRSRVRRVCAPPRCRAAGDRRPRSGFPGARRLRPQAGRAGSGTADTARPGARCPDRRGVRRRR